MVRTRKTDTHLPRRMRRSHGAYYYVAHLGQRRYRWIPLGKDYGEALRKWATLAEARPAVVTTVGDALDVFLTERVPQLAASTQREYRRYAARLRRVYGEVHLSTLRPGDVGAYLDARDAPIEANREVAMLSSVYALAMRRGWCESNPCRGVRRNRERPRTALPRDAQIESLRLAADDQVRCIVDLALLTGLRKGDLLAMRLSSITDAGLQVRVSKTGAMLCFRWTPALREVVARARALRRRVGAMTLFATSRGQPYSPSGFDSAWQRLRTRSGVAVQFRDLRAYALTRAARIGGRDYAQALAAHASGETTERYIRGREYRIVDPLG